MTTPATAPAPIGPYCIGKMIVTEGKGTWGYSSGALGLCAKTGDFVSQEPGPQSDKALANL